MTDHQGIAPSTDRQAAPSIDIVAAVARAAGQPFTLEAARLQRPRPDEVLVRLVATGMCHTDLSARDAELPHPAPRRARPRGRRDCGGGWLACGSCSAWGSRRPDLSALRQVPGLPAGEPASCASLGPLCFAGSRPDGSHAITAADGGVLHDRFFGQSSFANFAIAHKSNVIPVRKDARLELLGPLGCGVMTGAGAVWNALKLQPGSSFAVFGAGAVGLSAAMAARVNGAASIVCHRSGARSSSIGAGTWRHACGERQRGE